MKFNPDLWPKDGWRFSCTARHPMPTPCPKNTYWTHEGRQFTSDGEYHDWYRCKDCGHSWPEELPE